MQTTMEHLKSVVATEHVTGKPIVAEDGTMIIPLHKISVGIVSGGGQMGKHESKSQLAMPFAGGGGGGLNITPVGFLVVDSDQRKLMKLNAEQEGDKWTDMISNVVQMLRPKRKK